MTDTLDPTLDFDVAPIVTPDTVPDQTLQEAFEAYHAANPWVLTAFERLTADWVAKGNTRLGIAMLTEIIRWRYGREIVSADVFRINNNHRSRYVRLLLDRHPEWTDVFVIRTLRSE